MNLPMRALLAFLTCTVLGTAAAQPYPSRPVKMIIPAPTGGAVDTIARLVSQKLSDALGQPFVPDNRPGAGTMIGSELLAKSPPDGYTTLMITSSHAINAGLRTKLAYDPVNDFTPVLLLATMPDLLLVHPGVPAKNVREFLELARRQPGKLTFSSAGTGSGTHLGGELLKSMAKVDILHVPYKGGTPALQDLIGGHVQMMFNNPLSVLPLVKEGKLRALGIASSKRSALLPDLPTIAEQGLPGFESGAWFGVLLPARAPAPVVATLNREIIKVLRAPDVREKLGSLGAEIVESTPEEFGSYLRNDIDRWKKLVEANPRLRIND